LDIQIRRTLKENSARITNFIQHRVKWQEVGDAAGNRQAETGLVQRTNGRRAFKRRGIALANAPRTASFRDRSNRPQLNEFAPAPAPSGRCSR
jgi:hypothetical protein